jgi:hypothetical protein
LNEQKYAEIAARRAMLEKQIGEGAFIRGAWDDLIAECYEFGFASIAGALSKRANAYQEMFTE